MPNPHPSRVQQPYGLKSMRTLNADPRFAALMAQSLVRDYHTFRDDFDQLTIAGSTWWTATNTGTSSADPILNVQAGGAARFVSGTSTPSTSVLYGTRLANMSDDNPFFYLRFKMPAVITNLLFEIGFVNIATTKTTQVVTDIDTPSVASNGLTNGVVLACDMSQTLVTPALVGVGTSIAVAKTNITMSGGTVWTPTASKWVEVYIGARVGVGYCEIYENDVFIGQFTVASGPDTATLMFPWLLFGGSGGVAKTYDVDIFQLVEERNTR